MSDEDNKIVKDPANQKTLLVTMNLKAAEALAEKWFLIGFMCTGKGFHGETYNLEKYPSIMGLLLSEFKKRWNA